ncbi:MAG: HutD family protein [Lysobacterales bacterium]
MSALRVLGASDYRRMRWLNGGGWTTEIAREPADPAQAFQWRVSIADVEADGPFSMVPGVSRDLVLLEGAGVELEFPGGRRERLTRRFQHLQFDGADNVQCRLVDGPTRDFNVMTRDGFARATVLARPLVDSMVLFREPGAGWLVHVHAGSATCEGEGGQWPLGAGATLRADAAAMPERLVVRGGGELVLVKLAIVG